MLLCKKSRELLIFAVAPFCHKNSFYYYEDWIN